MVDESKLSSFWNQDVPGQFKHYYDSEFDAKIPKYQEDLQEHLFSKIDFCDIKLALDWGCGGGLGSLLLSEHCQVAALDIAETSLEQCKATLQAKGKEPQALYHLENIDSLKIDPKPDLLFSVSVIQHFPSYDYWRKVLKFWQSLEPKCVAIQTRHGAENKSHEEVYFDSTSNYILGLYLTTEEVTSGFSDEYDLTYHKLIEDGHSDYEYFVFRRKA